MKALMIARMMMVAQITSVICTGVDIMVLCLLLFDHPERPDAGFFVIG